MKNTNYFIERNSPRMEQAISGGTRGREAEDYFDLIVMEVARNLVEPVALRDCGHDEHLARTWAGDALCRCPLVAGKYIVSGGNNFAYRVLFALNGDIL